MVGYQTYDDKNVFRVYDPSNDSWSDHFTETSNGYSPWRIKENQ